MGGSSSKVVYFLNGQYFDKLPQHPERVKTLTICSSFHRLAFAVVVTHRFTFVQPALGDIHLRQRTPLSNSIPLLVDATFVVVAHTNSAFPHIQTVTPTVSRSICSTILMCGCFYVLDCLRVMILRAVANYASRPGILGPLISGSQVPKLVSHRSQSAFTVNSKKRGEYV